MTTFNKLKRAHYAVIFPTGKVEVRQAESDSIAGRVYFTCATKAYTVTMLLIGQGLICVKRRGWKVTPKGFVESKDSYHLGAVLIQTRDADQSDEIAKSKMIHEVCDART